MRSVCSGRVVRGLAGRGRCLRGWATICAAVAGVGVIGTETARGMDVSSPAVLQWFEGSWKTIGNRTGDILAAGYGGVWTPPPGRGDSGGFSSGYDVYDRFDLGSPGNPTHYGTEAGIKRMTSMFHRAGVSAYFDLVWNHDGHTDWWSSDGGNSFLAAGGYPGFYMGTGGTSSGGNWGDFHSPFASGDEDGKISNLVDIDHSTTNWFIRNPVNAGDPQNLPAGTVYAFGRKANVPSETNRRFYPDLGGPSRVINVAGGGSYTLYSFNTANPMAGDPVVENATGYLMRNAQWLVQVIGADGFRLDATKNMPAWVLNYYDQAVFGTSTRPMLDGSQRNVFAFGEYYGDDMGALQARRRNDITSANTLGGNRDNLDFPLYWAMQANLKSSGTGNDWRNVVNASFDRNDDGLANNGSQGVAFVQSHDSGGPPPDLANVAYAYTLMRPGNAIVYFNGQEFGATSFPTPGRGDALGGLYGNAITTLVNLRNQYGRGNYQERWLEKELLAYEREDSALVLLNNRGDAGWDGRTLQTSFAPGTHLVELTGNAMNVATDPNNDIPDTLVVDGTGKVNARFLRNVAPGTSNFTGAGYLIYGPKSPVGTLSLGGAGSVIAGGTPTAGTNGTTRLTSIRVVTGDAFTVTLGTNAVTLSDGYRDHDADGDNAVLRLDGGVDVNGNGYVDYVTPGSVVYGFEEFTGVHTPGYGQSSGNGTYAQTIDATGLSEGYHYVTGRAFRHRNSNEPAIFTDFTQTVYVDRLKPVSAVASFAGNGNDRTVVAQSVDGTANNVHFLLDTPGNWTDAQVLAQVNGGTQGTGIDVDQWSKSYTNLGSGNHVVTVVTYELTGNVNVQRFAGYGVAGTRGKGVGDVNFDNVVNSTDMSTFSAVLQQNDGVFNAGSDVNGDGHITLSDAFLMGPQLTALGADASTMNAYTNSVVNSAFVKAGTYNVTGTHVVYDVTAGTTNVSAGAVLVANSINGTTLNVADGGIAKVNGPSKLQTLSILGTGQLDLGTNSLVLDYTGATPAIAVRALLLSGRNSGTWDASGLVSSMAGPDGRTALGYVEASDLLGLSGDATVVWSGQVVDATSLLIEYTWYGDANLDGRVDGDDFALLDRGRAKGLGGWANGDFNYDGAIDAGDYLLADSGYAWQGGSLSPAFLAAREAEFGAGYVKELLAVAPEPGGVVLMMAGAVAGLGRRRVS